MNREIKFKAIRKDGGGWAYGYLTHTQKHLPPCIHVGIVEVYEVIPETVCQFTGLFDKNGKEIYANDLTIDKDGNKTVVVWINEWAMFGCMFLDEFEEYIQGGIKELDESMFWTFPIENESLEVIGSIHEGKETKGNG
ncbi:YopX family protein [Sphingobacterium spiritivorum]|uniref:YopX family protein n=1 Tax=Sphingobacterium spiritivorum TaxID=258 RepID=UPI003DA280A9